MELANVKQQWREQAEGAQRSEARCAELESEKRELTAQNAALRAKVAELEKRLPAASDDASDDGADEGVNDAFLAIITGKAL